MNGNITVFNFSGVYEEESFYRSDKSSCFCDAVPGDELPIKRSVQVLDMKDIPGTNCMCDDRAVLEIKEKISRDYLYGLHFIDSGNYHYMSYILLSMIKEPFSLIVFDHHPDMQPPMFGDILSCGGWVQKVIEDNDFVRDVHIIGADRELIDKLDENNVKRVHFYDIEDVQQNGLPKTEYPLYLSVDKDVVKRDELITNWDQGEMGKEELLGYIHNLMSAPDRKLIGVDICGECALDQEGIDVGAAIAGNDGFNLRVMSLAWK